MADLDKLPDWDDLTREELMRQDVRDSILFLYKKFNRTMDVKSNETDSTNRQYQD